MLAYDVIRAVYRCGAYCHRVVSVAVVAGESGLSPDAIRAVARADQRAAQLDGSGPLLYYSARLDEIGTTSGAERAIREWEQNPHLYEHDERTWRARAQRGEIDGAVIPSGGSMGAAPRDEEARLLARMRWLQREINSATAHGIICRRCGATLGHARYRPGRRVCRRCEARAQARRDGRR